MADLNCWFHTEKIDDCTYVISEYKHWEQTHCYLLLGSRRAVLIDTGLGISNIKDVVSHLTTLPVTVLTTHVHWDHIGGHGYFDDFAVHEAEIHWVNGNFPLTLDTVRTNLTRFPCSFPAEFDPTHYQIFQGPPTRILQDGDILDLGNRYLTVIHTPGHSPGHCCFYEPDRKYLYSGDLIYLGCLDIFYPTTDPLKFYQSIQKIRKLDVQRILPGHHTLDISTDIIKQVETAFHQLDSAGKLIHGSGRFDFDSFQIHL